MINKNSLLNISLSVGIAVLFGSIVLYISSAFFTGAEPIVETEIDARLNYYLKIIAFAMLFQAILTILGSVFLRRNIKSGKVLLIAGAAIIAAFPLLAIWQTHKVFGFSTILIVLIIGWLMITAIFAAFIHKLKRI